MIIHLYCIRVFTFVTMNFIGVKKTKCGGGGCCEKTLRGVCRRGVKKTKCEGRGGGDVLQTKNRGGPAYSKCGGGGGCCEKTLRGVCRRGVKKTKCEGGAMFYRLKIGEGQLIAHEIPL